MAGTAYPRYSQRTVTKRSGGRYDCTEQWIVPEIENTGTVDDPPADAWQHEALGADGLPQIGDWSQDGQMLCVSLTPKSLDNQGWAYVDVRWQEDPLTLATEVHYFSASKTKPAWQGRAVYPAGSYVPTNSDDDLFDDDPIEDIRNSAGDRYNPPVTYDVAMQRVEIVTRMSLQAYDAIDWDTFLKHWNENDYDVTQKDPDNSANDSTTPFPEGSLMMVDLRAPLVKEPFFHRLVTCVFLFDPDLWGARLPDMGPRCLKHLGPDGSGGVKLIPWTSDGNGRGTVTDALGRPYSGSAELDGEGNQLLPDSDGKMPQAKIYQWWPVNDDGNLFSADFGDLDLFTPERTLDV